MRSIIPTTFLPGQKDTRKESSIVFTLAIVEILYFDATILVKTKRDKFRYKSYVIPGETLIPGGSVSPWYWICLISSQVRLFCFIKSFKRFQ